MRHPGGKPKGTGEVERPKPVLIVQHAKHEHPAIVRRSLEAQGVPTFWVHPYRGEALPALKSIRGMISLGGPMGANDEEHHPWILREMELMNQAMDAGFPTVGICLGGQMLARAMGGSVTKNTIAEVGWFPVELNEAGAQDRILGGAGSSPLVYQWHNDTFHLPPGAELLASSQACPRQAYRIGEKAYGFQFHPEADHQLIHEWLAVSGVEDEIEQAKKEHGSQTVQDADIQRNRASKGEKSSLKITAAITQLFQTRPYEPIAADFYSQLEFWLTHKSVVTVELKGPDRKTFRLKGTIVVLFTIREGEFLIFREENSLLWPIRMDYIQKILLG